MRRLGPWKLLGLALVLIYGARAVQGWIGGAAYVRGRWLAGNGEYERALPLLERGAIGRNRSIAVWLSGQVRMGLWQPAVVRNASDTELERLYRDAFRDYTEAISMSPALGWYWVDLGDLYYQRERLEQFRFGVPLEALNGGLWARVGQPGRIAVGLIVEGIRREPTWYAFHDQLAFTYLAYGMDDAMTAAVRRSAAAQPDYRQHAYLNLRPVPPQILDAFAEGAREALGRTPLLRRTLHLIALGRVEWRRGAWSAAVEVLEQALDQPGEAINRAEASYYYGLSLMELGELERAGRALVQAGSHPAIASMASAGQARLAERQGDLARALQHYGAARRIEPRRLAYALEFARIAVALEDWRRGEQALRWAVRIAPTDPAPRRRLFDLLLRAGEPVKAGEQLRALQRMGQSTDELERRLEAVRGSSG